MVGKEPSISSLEMILCAFVALLQHLPCAKPLHAMFEGVETLARVAEAAPPVHHSVMTVSDFLNILFVYFSALQPLCVAFACMHCRLAPGGISCIIHSSLRYCRHTSGATKLVHLTQ